MLILTRRPGERVVIGEEVTVTVMEVAGQTVRLGIDAPKGLPVYREEIWLSVKAENVASAGSTAQALEPADRAAAQDGASGEAWGDAAGQDGADLATADPAAQGGADDGTADRAARHDGSGAETSSGTAAGAEAAGRDTAA